MSNVNTNLSTKPPYGENVEEPSVKKLKSSDLEGNLGSSCSDVLRSLSASERSFKDIDGLRSCQNGRTSPKISKSEPDDGPTKQPASATLPCRNRQANPNKEVLSKDGFTSTSFIGPLFRPEIVKPKTEIEDELDMFYKELEQIAPEDVDLPDGNCNSDKSTIAKKQQYSASEQEIQSDLSQPTRHCGPYSGQVWQNRPHNLRHLHPHFQHWDASCPPPLQGSYNPFLGSAAAMRPLRHLYRCPFPLLPPPPPPRISLYPLVHRPRDNLRGPNRESLQWENMPFKSGHTNQGVNCDAYQGHCTFIPNEFGCNEPHTNKAECPQPYGQTSSFCQTNPEEFQMYQQAHPHPSRTVDPDSLMLILMRGAPGSGKSTLARELLWSRTNGLILSTDDYFLQEDRYFYDPQLLGDAHYWNQNRTREALCECRSPIIIDNTNMQAWEMKPYVQMALERGYIVCFYEPNTSWKYEPSELERRNKHGVPKQKIAKMLERFELPMTVDIVLNSQEPPRQSAEHAFKHQRKRKQDISDFQ